MTVTTEDPIQGTPSPETDARLASLAASVRSMRIWLTVVTVALALVLGCGGVSVATTVFGIGGLVNEMGGVSDDTVTKTEAEIKATYGSHLADVEVRAVTVEYGSVPFPYSLMPGTDSEALYVEYRLAGSDVVVADIVGDRMYGFDIASNGMLPTKGSLTSRMTEEQLDRLIVAYGAQTKAPLGAVMRYGDSPYPDEPGSQTQGEVTVGSTTYPARELWSATEGRLVKGDRVDMSEEDGFSRKALIFREDPEAGEFEFLGTEQVNTIW